MTNKYVQKGLNNKQKKEQKKQKLETILNTIDKNLFITDWNNALTYADIMKKYNIHYIAFYDQKSFENDEDIVYSLAKVKGVHIVPGTH